MIFKSDPGIYCKISNKYVQRATGMKGFYFDDKGEYATENEVLIKVMSQSFEVVEEAKEEAPEEVSQKPEEAPEPTLRHCKKCSFACVNSGELMAHYRKEHQKGAKKK